MLAARTRDGTNRARQICQTRKAQRLVTARRDLVDLRAARGPDTRLVTARTQSPREPQDVRLASTIPGAFDQEQNVQNSSPSPVALRVEPSPRKASITCFAICVRCTSSAPSTSLAERAFFNICSSGVSEE